MSMPADLIAVLEGNSDIAGMVADRIYPNVLPLEVWDSTQRRPNICYFVADEPRERTFCGADDLRCSHYMLHCSALTYDEAVTLADAVDACLEDLDVVSGETAIGPVHSEVALDNPEPEPGIYTKTVQFAVWHSRSE